MGAFTNDPELVQELLLAGVPVWFVRHARSLQADDLVLKRVQLEKPGFREGTGLFADLPIYEAWAGEQHLLAIAAHSHGYQDLDKILAPDMLHRDAILPPSSAALLHGKGPQYSDDARAASRAALPPSPIQPSGPIRQPKDHSSRSQPYEIPKASSSKTPLKEHQSGKLAKNLWYAQT
ncbi:hypothetical protein NM688_g5349 [Phlebia brevispora]|uniref:Uncharacterized protein n=1 Tax=Phlebia brevispora TaxID=194682 RepID=A0ACC1SWT8_9APHY|nr:hypothetical protein NM688_g5349 [Phlebia brevispora]